MNFRVEHRVGVRATADRIWEIIADLPSWTDWNPIETEIQGALAIRAPLSLTERIPGLPERRLNAVVGDWQPYAQLIWAERRGWQFGAIRYFEIEELAPGNCIVANGQIFSGLRGESFFGRHRRTLRAAFEQVGEAIRAQAES